MEAISERPEDLFWAEILVVEIVMEASQFVSVAKNIRIVGTTYV